LGNLSRVKPALIFPAAALALLRQRRPPAGQPAAPVALS
jgi:hypothetical protein